MMQVYITLHMRNACDCHVWSVSCAGTCLPKRFDISMQSASMMHGLVLMQLGGL